MNFQGWREDIGGRFLGWADDASGWASSEREIKTPDHIPPSELPQILDASGWLLRRIGKLVLPYDLTDEGLGLLADGEYNEIRPTDL